MSDLLVFQKSERGDGSSFWLERMIGDDEGSEPLWGS